MKENIYILFALVIFSCSNNNNTTEKEKTVSIEQKNELVETTSKKDTIDTTHDREYISTIEEGKMYYEAVRQFDKDGAAALTKRYRQPINNANDLYQWQRQRTLEQRKKMKYKLRIPSIPGGWEQPMSIAYNNGVADIAFRYGDADNFGYGWPIGFDPFSGESTPRHDYPFYPEPDDPVGTDRIMVVSGYTYSKETFSMKKNEADGYTKTTVRPYNNPVALNLQYDIRNVKVQHALLQILADDFQGPTYHSQFKVWIDGKEITAVSILLNELKQSGPIGKLISFQILPELIPIVQSGKFELKIDDPDNHSGDGFAIDFVQLLVNPKNIPVSGLTGKVIDAKTKKPIDEALLKISGAGELSSGSNGEFHMNNVPCGMVIVQADKAGYKKASVSADIIKEKIADVLIKLEPESSTNLQQQLEEKGKIELYGIYFDTDKATIKPESEKTLNQVLELVKNNTKQQLEISGHTDAQGNEQANYLLSEKRAAAVIEWLRKQNADVSALKNKGYGETQPVADNNTETGRALNRRVEIELINTKE